MSLQVLANRYLQFFFFCLFILVLLLGVSFYHLGYWYLRLRSFLWLHNGHLHWFLVPFLVMLLVSQQKTWDVLYRLSFEKLLQMFVSSKEAGCSDILRETPQKKMCASPSCSSSPTVEVSPGTGWLRARQALSHFILSSLKHCLLTPQSSAEEYSQDFLKTTGVHQAAKMMWLCIIHVTSCDIYQWVYEGILTVPVTLTE